MSRWFRHYAGMMRDEKLVAAAVRSKQPIERVVWVYGAILESAAEVNDAGRYNLDTAEVAYFLRADEADVVCILDCLHQLGRLSDGCVATWGKRQFKSDNSKERVAEHRERQSDRNAGKAGEAVTSDGRNGDVTARNGDATECNAPETETKLDTEKKEHTSAKPTLRVSSEKFEAFWSARPRRLGDDPKKPAEKKFNAYVRSGIDPDMMIRSMKAACKAAHDRNIVGTSYVPQTIKWLNDQRFLDYAEAEAEAVVVPKGFYAEPDSEQLAVWDEHTRSARGKGLPRDRNGGWWVSEEWPPGYTPRDREAA